MKTKTIMRVLFVLMLALGTIPAFAQDVEPLAYEDDLITFTYDSSVAVGIEAIPVEEVPLADDDMPYWAANPAFTQYFFVDYAGGSKEFFHTPQISVYPTGNFPLFTPEGVDAAYTLQGQYEALAMLLEEKPDLSEYAGQITTSGEGNLPLLPQFNAAQVFRVKIEYVEFAGGTGIRFLTYYSQAINPIVDNEIFFTFQGLTDDGAYYISAIFPVSTGIFPDEIDFESFDYDAFAEDYTPYLNDVIEALNAQADEDFSPGLDQLDAVIESIEIHQ